MSTVAADAVTALLNRESALETASTGAKSWLQLQPNGGGLQGLKAQLDSVAREILSKNLTPEAGDIVGLSVAPKLVHDLNKDLFDALGGDWWRCLAVHAGNKGQSQYRPTAVVDGGASADSYTVPALGDLTAGLLINVKGCTNSENNGVKVVVATSADTAIKVATGSLVAETNPTNATIDVCGVQGAATDISITAANHLFSTVLDFTTLGLIPGQEIKIGDTATTGMSFATDQNGTAEIVSVAAHLITLKNWSKPVLGIDAGTGKTIRLLWSRVYRNYALGHAKFSQLTSQIEMEQPGAGVANVSSFRYVKGLRATMLELDAPLKNKIVATTSFIGTDCPDPVLQASRPADTATALEPLATSMFDTTNDVKHIKLYTASTGADLGDGTKWIETWKFSQNLGLKPREVQGDLGAVGHTEGRIVPSLTIGGYLTYDEIIKAARDNRDIGFVVVAGNEDGGFALRVPAMKARNPDETMALGDAVKLSLDTPAHRNTTTGIISVMTVFGYYPTT